MSEVKRTKPELWERIKNKWLNGKKAGIAGKWNARKAQLATIEYKQKGGGYVGPKKNNSLSKWTKEEWVDVKTGKPCGRKSAKKGESKRPYPSCRPKSVAAKMTKAEKASSARRKTGPKAIKHAVTASGRRRKSTRKT
jgi:hypothetical protein